jgi:hypothetical protein
MRLQLCDHTGASGRLKLLKLRHFRLERRVGRRPHSCFRLRIGSAALRRSRLRLRAHGVHIDGRVLNCNGANRLRRRTTRLREADPHSPKSAALNIGRRS